MHYPEIPLCAITGGMKTNFILQRMFETAQEFGKGLLDVCSKKGVITAGNISFINSTFSVLLPAGNYRNSFRQVFDTFKFPPVFKKKITKILFSGYSIHQTTTSWTALISLRFIIELQEVTSWRLNSPKFKLKYFGVANSKYIFKFTSYNLWQFYFNLRCEIYM